jgi:glycosyltransferase involved in cell wall biosynthesis
MVSRGINVRAVGIGYRGEPHKLPFSVFPCETPQDALTQVINLWRMEKFDALVIALDIPAQLRFISALRELHKQGLKVISITALENPPLMVSWAIGLSEADHVFFISEMGEKEAKLTGLENVGHLTVGIDTKEWHPTKDETVLQMRKNLGFAENDVIILTVADNQERKNLSAGFEIIRNLKHRLPEASIKWILVTREKFFAGWNLRDLAATHEIDNELVIFERGMPANQLRILYQISNVFLLTSKAEGLCYPVMEAMSCGIPVVATNTGALPELIGDVRGWLVDVAFSFTDTWGNSKRDIISVNDATNKLVDTLFDDDDVADRALKYIEEKRKPEFMVDELVGKIKELCNAKPA